MAPQPSFTPMTWRPFGKLTRFDSAIGSASSAPAGKAKAESANAAPSVLKHDIRFPSQFFCFRRCSMTPVDMVRPIRVPRNRVFYRWGNGLQIGDTGNNRRIRKEVDCSTPRPGGFQVGSIRAGNNEMGSYKQPAIALEPASVQPYVDGVLCRAPTSRIGTLVHATATVFVSPPVFVYCHLWSSGERTAFWRGFLDRIGEFGAELDGYVVWFRKAFFFGEQEGDFAKAWESFASGIADLAVLAGKV